MPIPISPHLTLSNVVHYYSYPYPEVGDTTPYQLLLVRLSQLHQTFHYMLWGVAQHSHSAFPHHYNVDICAVITEGYSKNALQI